jgi:hypothetical protein
VYLMNRLNGGESSRDPRSLNAIFKIGSGAIIGIFLLITIFNLYEVNGANTIMVVQSPVKGTFHWYTDAGVKWQGFGKVTKYPKREIYEFKTPVRFNDGGHGTMNGSVSYELPLDDKNLSNIHMKFGSINALESQLISTIVNKAIYMTGPLMSSKESYAEKRNSLIQYVEDQIQNGVYKTVSKEIKTTDPMTGAEKNITVVEICMKNGIFDRQEIAAMNEFAIKTFNFAINSLPYDDAVENQIKDQQKLAMDVQTSIASAKKAEQDAITVAKKGEAEAAKAKWDQEVIKAKEVTLAQQKLEVAKLEAQAAEQTKRQQILLGEGEAGRKKLVMNANGALDVKVEAYEKIMMKFAETMGNYKGNWVPSVVMGESAKGVSGASDLIEMLKVKTAMDLGLDMSIAGKNQTAGK